jgi:hypothetical protein
MDENFHPNFGCKKGMKTYENPTSKICMKTLPRG